MIRNSYLTIDGFGRKRVKDFEARMRRDQLRVEVDDKTKQVIKITIKMVANVLCYRKLIAEHFNSM